jgi:glycosyltransferase involved in cell wall biosynthesis
MPQKTDKIKIVYHSNYHSAFTGFGKNAKNVLLYLFKTGKYDIVEAANGMIFAEEGIPNSPWKVYGTVPNDPALIERAKTDQGFGRMLSYGALGINRIIEKERPDVYIGAEDIWAFSEIVRQPWWNKIPCLIWTTLDSLPLLPEAIKNASVINNYFVWSSFAEKEAQRLGLSNIKTLHGIVDHSHFFRLPDSNRNALRNKYGIPLDCFVTGFVFRNQLRKTVGDLIKGFSILRKDRPELAAKLLLHTSWSEGWDIRRLMEEHGVKNSDVLTTYHCSHCKHVHVGPFNGDKIKCPSCGKADTFSTTSPANGVREEVLNEIYNLMDFYVHPFTSGGQEIPIQEAKLTELVTAVTNYTCGEEMCSPESGGIPLRWTEYREIGTQFIKASTDPLSICEAMKAFVDLPKEEKIRVGKLSRQYVINNYSPSVIGGKLDAILQELPKTGYTFDSTPDIAFSPRSRYNNVDEAIVDFFERCLKRTCHPESQEYAFAKNLFSTLPPDSVVAFFRDKAREAVNARVTNHIKESFKGDEASKKIAIVVPPDNFVALICKYFIDEMARTYPEYHLYVVANYQAQQILWDCESVYKFVDYHASFEDVATVERTGNYNMCFVFGRGDLNAALYSKNCEFRKMIG